MSTPFDRLLSQIQKTGYHNHRLTTHSDLLSQRILEDLDATCDAFAQDRKTGALQEWHNTIGPDRRNTDLIVGRANSTGDPDLTQVRILVEHKSVATAHRNRSARFQDIEREMLATHRNNPRTIIIATLLVGTCLKVLNVPDCVKKDARYTPEQFKREIRPRLSTGDQSLWVDFPRCISENTVDDPLKTIKMFQRLPVRGIADTHETALDYLLLIPVEIDNVNPPRLGTMPGIDPVLDYDRMIKHICQVYTIRWHGR